MLTSSDSLQSSPICLEISRTQWGCAALEFPLSGLVNKAYFLRSPQSLVYSYGQREILEGDLEEPTQTEVDPIMPLESWMTLYKPFPLSGPVCVGEGWSQWVSVENMPELGRWSLIRGFFWKQKQLFNRIVTLQVSKSMAIIWNISLLFA